MMILYIRGMRNDVHETVVKITIHSICSFCLDLKPII